ncbi:Uncharacterised protein [Mycobacterium tuberculosis]|nr:Uncharacterised protein [Mycobacterium tuberculosis]
MITSDSVSICCVKWQCRSSDTPMVTFGPTMERTREIRSPSQSS